MATFFSRRDSGQGTRKPVATARLGHFYLDLEDRLLHCLNETARQFIREEIPVVPTDLSRQPLQTLSGEPVTPADMPLVRARREQSPQEAVFVLSRPGVPPQHLTWSAAPLFAVDGKVLGILATLTVAPPEPDWQVLAGLAHDLRTPLQALRLMIPLMGETDPRSAEGRELLGRLSSTTERALSIGLDLLEWARGPTLRGRKVETGWFPLAPLLSSLVAEQLPLAKQKSITVNTDFAAAAHLEIRSDQVRLARLLSNLLSNAIRYTSAGLVRFSASRRPGTANEPEALVLSVVDTGVGISVEDQESIFMPFERGKAGKETDSSGSGVGLAVVDRLVDDLGLTLDVYSEYGHGSKFDLIIPGDTLRPTG
jgi:anti-sigma regulatory factor (Ser/Thr protein kinase)